MESADACWLYVYLCVSVCVCVCLCVSVCAKAATYFPWLTEPLMSLPARPGSYTVCKFIKCLHMCKLVGKQRM